MKRLLLSAILFTIYSVTLSQTQKAITECTITYRVEELDETGKIIPKGPYNNFSQIIYIKGKQARFDIITSDFKQSLIIDNANGKVAILKELGQEKYINLFDLDKWKQGQKLLFAETPTIIKTGETKNILGHICEKFTAVLKYGKLYTMYCVTSLSLPSTDIPFPFYNPPGLVLELEEKHPDEHQESNNKQKTKIRYTAISVEQNPIPASKFEIPKSGYKLLQN